MVEIIITSHGGYVGDDKRDRSDIVIKLKNMVKYRSIKIKVDNCTVRQKLIVCTYNYLLWLAIRLFKNDEQRQEKEIKELIKTCYDLL